MEKRAAESEKARNEDNDELSVQNTHDEDRYEKKSKLHGEFR